MGMSMRQPAGHPRRHGPVVEPEDRRQLERDGWRTTIDYRENHVRGRNGQLLEVEPVWTAEAERFDGQLSMASAVAASAELAWSVLRDEIEAHHVRTTSPRVRLLRRA
jgi:hypothetical protein